MSVFTFGTLRIFWWNTFELLQKYFRVFLHCNATLTSSEEALSAQTVNEYSPCPWLSTRSCCTLLLTDELLSTALKKERIHRLNVWLIAVKHLIESYMCAVFNSVCSRTITGYSYQKILLTVDSSWNCIKCFAPEDFTWTRNTGRGATWIFSTAWHLTRYWCLIMFFWRNKSQMSTLIVISVIQHCFCGPEYTQ